MRSHSSFASPRQTAEASLRDAARSAYYWFYAAGGHYGRQQRSEGRKILALKRMDNVLIVVEDLEAVKAFFIELGLELEGETTVEGPAVASLIGLEDVRATLA